jgi:hypothetical protein
MQLVQCCAGRLRVSIRGWGSWEAAVIADESALYTYTPKGCSVVCQRCNR